MKLTGLEIRRTKASEKLLKLSDGQGLFLHVHPNGSKYWRMRYRFNGKEQTLAIGVYPTISLIEAREIREQARKLLAQEINPNLIKRQKKKYQSDAENKFKALALEWFNEMAPHWVPRHAKTIKGRLDNYILPTLGNFETKQITSPIVLEVLNTIKQTGHLELAKRVRQIIGQIFWYGVATLRADTDPSWALRGAIPTSKVRHMPPIT